MAAQGEPRLVELLLRAIRSSSSRAMADCANSSCPRSASAAPRQRTRARSSAAAAGAGWPAASFPAALLEEILEAAGVELLRRERQDIAVLPGGQRGSAVR